MPRLLLDTNIIVRFLTGDHPTHSPRRRRRMTLVLTDFVLAETA
jgi:predicted nucleic acid-binding protein